MLSHKTHREVSNDVSFVAMQLSQIANVQNVAKSNNFGGVGIVLNKTCKKGIQ